MALEGSDLLEATLLVLDVVTQALELLLLGGLLLVTLLLLLQVAQPLLLAAQVTKALTLLQVQIFAFYLKKKKGGGAGKLRSIDSTHAFTSLKKRIEVSADDCFNLHSLADAVLQKWLVKLHKKNVF